MVCFKDFDMSTLLRHRQTSSNQFVQLYMSYTKCNVAVRNQIHTITKYLFVKFLSQAMRNNV